MRLGQQLEALQHALRAERQSRDDEQADHAAMLRELQGLIAREREEKEALVKQVRPEWGSLVPSHVVWHEVLAC